MKTSFKILSSVTLMAAALGANASPPMAPSMYDKGPLSSSTNPGLFTPERAVFAALESAMQVAEGSVYVNGCSLASGTYGMKSFVDEDGYGSVTVSSGGAPQFTLNVSPSTSYPAPVGTSFVVKGNGHLGGTSLNSFSSAARYSAGGAMMTEGATFDMYSWNGSYDKLSGFIIKDFWKAVPISLCSKGCGDATPVIYDWGIQSLHKNTVPQDKWWQRSVATRSNGVPGKTVWVKDRIFSAKYAGVCSIRISLSGTNEPDLFAQDGTFTVSKIAPQVK